MSGATQMGRHGLEAFIVKGMTLTLLLVLLAPIVMVIAMSFTAATTLQFPPPALSLRWYEEVLALLAGPDADFARLAESLMVSLEIAVAASLVCVLAGVPASYALVRLSFRGRGLPTFQQLSALDSAERVAPLAQRHAPIRDRARRVSLEHAVERFVRRAEFEGVEE